MIIRRLTEVDSVRVEAPNGNWCSRRFLLARDGMGFSLHDTIIRANTETFIWYKHHLEAVYCIAGRGEVEDLATGIVHPIASGTVYALDGHEKHLLRAFDEDMRMICVFNPPLTGAEVHDDEGIYPLLHEPAAN
jgi:L-ectoine synthase